MTTEAATALPEALERLGAALRDAELELPVPGLDAARAARRELVDQIEDYLLPRLRQMDAPLLMVVGGSTGAGKSTLVNSLVGADVSPAGVLRPTTRAPVLVCHPDDVAWFEGDRVLPGMSRTRGASPDASGTYALELVPTVALPPGLALLDSPDIDSVVEANRALSRQLLAAERGLEGTELLVVEEAELAGGRLPDETLAPVRAWLDGLAADAQARSGLVRRTLTGALDSLPRRAGVVLGVLADQAAEAQALHDDAEQAYARGLEEVDEAVRSGALLRGEVLARWHDVVGTGDLMRALESRLGRLRDRLRSLVTGTPAAEAELRTAVESSVDAVVYAAADRAAERAAAAWRGRPAGRALLEGTARLDAASPELLDRTRGEVRSWQGEVFNLVSQEGAGKRSTARIASLGVNGAGLVVMIAVFAHTGGLTGAEVAVAGGTTAVGQRLLEALLGDQAVRTLAARAREDLLERAQVLLGEEAARFHALLEA